VDELLPPPPPHADSAIAAANETAVSAEMFFFILVLPRSCCESCPLHDLDSILSSGEQSQVAAQSRTRSRRAIALMPDFGRHYGLSEILSKA
jgi:hypothetical protein